MASWSVFLTADAVNDLEHILDYIERHDSSERADYVYEQIKQTILSLHTAPKRGRVVPELKDIGVFEYREVFFKPYRIVYYTVQRTVFVFAIFDGRRNLEDVLHRRLLP